MNVLVYILATDSHKSKKAADDRVVVKRATHLFVDPFCNPSDNVRSCDESQQHDFFVLESSVFAALRSTCPIISLREFIWIFICHVRFVAHVGASEYHEG